MAPPSRLAARGMEDEGEAERCLLCSKQPLLFQCSVCIASNSIHWLCCLKQTAPDVAPLTTRWFGLVLHVELPVLTHSSTVNFTWRVLRSLIHFLAGAGMVVSDVADWLLQAAPAASRSVTRNGFLSKEVHLAVSTRPPEPAWFFTIAVLQKLIPFWQRNDVLESPRSPLQRCLQPFPAVTAAKSRNRSCGRTGPVAHIVISAAPALLSFS